MKQFLLLIAGLLALAGPARAQAPAWQTAVLAGNGVNAASFTSVTATATDAAGNVYVAGGFYGTVSFGGVSLTSAGNTDGYVAKWSRASGTFVWAQRLGGTGADDVQALAVSGASVYLAGYFGLTAGFGPTNLTSFGSDDVFVAKLTDAGSTAAFTWAVRAGGAGVDRASAMSVSGASVYLTGLFLGTANFGSIPLMSAGQVDVFVAKLTDAGTTAAFGWAQRAGGPGIEDPRAVVVSGTSVYVAGSFQAVADFGTTTLTCLSGYNLFVAKLTDAGATGSFTWARQGASSAYNGANGLAASGGSVYLSGTFYGSLGLGSLVLASAGQGDAFLAKLTDTGPAATFGWALRAGGTSNDVGLPLVASGSDLYWAGYFNGVSTFGNTTFTAVGPTTGDVFVARLVDTGPAGSFVWAQQAGGPLTEYAYALALSGTGALYVGGLATPPAAFGSLSLTSPFANTPTGFLAALQTTPTATAAPVVPVAPALYPNPVLTGGTVRVPGATAATGLVLLDALGRTVTQSTGTALGLTGVAPGLYLLRILSGATTATQKLVVE